MLSFIGFITICFFCFVLVRMFFKKTNPLSRRIGYGAETRKLAVEDLGVNHVYFNYITNNHINEVKNKAIYLSSSNYIFKGVSWPRLMAASIYLFFYKDCENGNIGEKFNLLGFDQDEVLNTNPQQLISLFVRADDDYEFSANSEIRKLVIEHSRIGDNSISYSKLDNRLFRFTEEEECGAEFFGDYRGWRFILELDDKVYSAYIKYLNPEQQEKSSISLSVFSD